VFSRALGEAIDARGRRERASDTVTINGQVHDRAWKDGCAWRFLRVQAGYTGVHIGCEHGVCGACTVIVDWEAGTLPVDAGACRRNGAEIVTVRGGRRGRARLHRVQQRCATRMGCQCGFCTRVL